MSTRNIKTSSEIFTSIKTTTVSGVRNPKITTSVSKIEADTGVLLASSKYVIEKGIPFPRRKRASMDQYPFLNMQVGDSFFMEGEDYTTTEGRACVAAAQYFSKRNPDTKFSFRKSDDGLRCHRVMKL
jgi:hypothetical protein